MAFQYKFLKDGENPETSFEVTADSWVELFTGATEALSHMMVDLKNLKANARCRVDVSAGTVDELLFDWLSELIYLKDTEGLVVESLDITVEQDPLWQVHGTIHGQQSPSGNLGLGQDVKSVAYHLLDVSEKNGCYTARVTLDI